MVKLSLYACAVAAMAMVSTAAPVENTAPVVRMDLQRNPDFHANATYAVIKAQRKYAKYTIQTKSIKPGSVSMTDYLYDVEYYGVVKVGTPPQSLKLDFDTGSSDMWFASTLCSTCSSTQTKFDPSKSSTYQQDGRPWSISYGDGSTASGVIGYDVVDLGGLKINKQAIELAKKESAAFQSDPIDGLLGLGFDSIAAYSDIKTPMSNLISQGVVSQPVFGVFLGKQSQGGGGEYVFGGYNEAHIGGALTTVSVDKSQGFWGITVDGLSSGNRKVAGAFHGILDTGTTLMIFTDSMARQVASLYGARDNRDGTFTISCDTASLPPLVLTIGGTKFTIPSSDLIYAKFQGQCIAGFSYAGLPFAILGDVFLKNHYVIFNQKVPNVQIAPVKY
ncbi:syncephapepsin precursor [Radiomyces spectabilis]|uniref:syncephapepsin precursor n=1 Tax=Radiomyces spectabilis TaxID=64574 RepID=UPI00221E533F|nr:syncephapepsin precursor [Radiomyces spectabilis]KAI8394227.1 syncephapepsin precursor [Radiomyces spectabilis]